MAKKRILKSEKGVTLIEQILFGGTPRTRIGTAYVVETAHGDRKFETREAATRFFHVQVGLGARRTSSGRDRPLTPV